MAEGFRLERILIEGFKGFTKAQEIDLKNRHVFLLGPNAKGKSSIVEPMRGNAYVVRVARHWCSELERSFQFSAWMAMTVSSASAKVGTPRGEPPRGSRPSAMARAFSRARSRAIARVTMG